MSSITDVEELVARSSGGWVPRGLLGPTSEQLARLASEHNWLFVEVSLRGSTDKKALMRRLADKLDFPPEFGSNWDAVADSMWDVSADQKGTILRLKGLGEIPPMLADPLADILADRTRHGPTPCVVVADPPLPLIANQGA